ncbi:LysE family translocator [Spirulina subsalsa]|uniref:LysE family translocator n=1 Tax=Spirulina subsalsa TaxID=54311 RepID=UPI0002E9F9C8|nr:LysE family transporter [Spirulina subsalsa]
MLPLFLQGMVFGFAIAAPIGAIGFLCIQRTLNHGRLIGLLSGLGAATADGIYGCIASLGLGLMNPLLDHQGLLRLLGGLFLVYLGVQTFTSKPPSPDPETLSATASMNGFFAYSSTLFLTLTNPLTIFFFLSIFSGLGLGEHHHFLTAFPLILGVFTGSALWWLLLSSGVNHLRHKVLSNTFTVDKLKWINRLSGIILISFAVILFYSNFE